VNSVRQSLYLKYRPQRFAELVGQEVVAETLRSAVREGRLSHAYLFTGIRGTGKTSAARILARAINCEAVAAGEPCGLCAACLAIAGERSLDVIEIDAATNRGIDEIRDLRERVQFLPSQFKTKVYIIDEAHMLTLEAGNAFLKTLEEPPEHACFILATTEPQRLADTVRSRCQRFDFRQIPVDAMAAHLARICELEGAPAASDALSLVAEAGAGSLRDALSLLDRLLGLADGELTRERVQAGLGMADPRALGRLANQLSRRDMGAAWGELRELQAAGVEPRQLMRSLGALARLHLWRELGGKPVSNQLAEIPAPPGFWLELMTSAAGAGAELRRADDPWMSLEATLLRLCGLDRERIRLEPTPPRQDATPAPTPDAKSKGTEGEVTTGIAVPDENLEQVPPELAGAGVAADPLDLAPAGAVQNGGDAVGRWGEILAWIGRDNIPVQALLKSGRPTRHQDGVLTLEFDPKFEFHRGQLQSPANRELLRQACLGVLGVEVVVEVTSTTEPAGGDEPGGAVSEEGQGSALSQAMQVFPGSRVTRLGTGDGR